MFGATGLGWWIGHRLRARGDGHRESLSVVQGALLGMVGLLLAFGLALAIGRYQVRLTANVDDANAIGAAHLRAQLLAEPYRTESLSHLVAYTDAEIAFARSVPRSDEARAATAVAAGQQREL